ncbi:MAG: type IV toxin-antitoxin system AbiEi family antitoxin domain-containing protein [Candidatus Ancillula sp.]|nr:type IV toxin-antitoxin system AbiEi family antitoxin domain-containing protein [Candidatus Ancillula sp.]
MSNKILNLAKQNNGLITTKQVDKLGLSRSELTRLKKDGRLEESARGVYILPDYLDDFFFNLQNRYTKGIFNLNTALYLHNMSDRTPEEYDMAFPTGSTRPKNVELKISAKTESQKFYGVGKVAVETPAGHKVTCYSIERTLCDIVRPVNRVDSQIVSQAFKVYAQMPNKNLKDLGDFAKLLKVQDKINSYMEVLL